MYDCKERPWTEVEAADYLQTSKKTLANWRSLNRGPRYCKAGRLVRYYKTDLDNWLESRRSA